MKKNRAAILMIPFLFACSNKEKHASDPGEWKELDAYHKIMAEAYHPLKDSGNLAPAKSLINQLADEAEKWSEAPLPDKVNTPEVKAKLQKLKTEARALADDNGSGASDEIIKQKMIELHDQFHSIMATWNHQDEAGEDDEHENH